jgi:molybdenum cofactor biosynthesis protein B
MQDRPHSKLEMLKFCPRTIEIGVVIVSTSRFKEQQEGLPSTERCLPIFKQVLNNYEQFIKDIKYHIKFEKIISDDVAQIQQTVKEEIINAKSELQCLIFSGGTGITKKDITIEAIRPLFEKELPGFGEIFRQFSFEVVKTSTILSRATAGVIKDTIVFCVPGSPNAVDIALNKIIGPELPHIMGEIYREKK